MQRSLKELMDECKAMNFTPFPGHKYSKRELIKFLAETNIIRMGGIETLSWGMRQRLEIESPMLCFAYKHLKLHEKQVCMESDSWIAERKLDGCRIIITYHPDEGFGFFSRNISVKDYLPVDYTEKILVKWVDKVGVVRGANFVGTEGIPKLSSAYDFKGMFHKPFVLDAEVLCDAENIDTTIYRGDRGTVTGAQLNAATSILSIETEDSHKIQRDQAPLRLVVFDVLQIGDRNLIGEPFSKRLVARSAIVCQLLDKGIKIGVVDSNGPGVSKQEFYDQMVAEGGEGIVLKNLESGYISTTSRPRTGFVKRKRSMEEAAGADIDAFITGFVPSNPNKSWAHLIGALELSVILVGEDGTEEDHVIAAVSSMPLKMREEMTEIIQDGDYGTPVLKEEYYNKVLVINGQDISPKALRFMHSTADWKRGFRTDKSHLDCMMEEKFLRSQVL